MKRILMAERVSNMRVLDTLGCLSNSTNPPEQLAALKNLTSMDNVHLTEEGYKALAAGLLKEAISLKVPREKGKEPVFSCQSTVNWN
jgi:lysophospholipase L1-like esterase